MAPPSASLTPIIALMAGPTGRSRPVRRPVPPPGHFVALPAAPFGPAAERRSAGASASRSPRWGAAVKINKVGRLWS